MTPTQLDRRPKRHSPLTPLHSAQGNKMCPTVRQCSAFKTGARHQMSRSASHDQHRRSKNKINAAVRRRRCWKWCGGATVRWCDGATVRRCGWRFCVGCECLSSSCHLSDFNGLLRHNRCHFKWNFIATSRNFYCWTSKPSQARSRPKKKTKYVYTKTWKKGKTDKKY